MDVPVRTSTSRTSHPAGVMGWLSVPSSTPSSPWSSTTTRWTPINANKTWSSPSPPQSKMKSFIQRGQHLGPATELNRSFCVSGSRRTVFGSSRWMTCWRWATNRTPCVSSHMSRRSTTIWRSLNNWDFAAVKGAVCKNNSQKLDWRSQKVLSLWFLCLSSVPVHPLITFLCEFRHVFTD